MPALANASQDGQSVTKPWQPDKDEQQDLNALNAAVTRLRNVTAADPYVLTIPQDVEPRYRHPHRAWAEQWLSNTPFDRSEHESLQYQTFFFHEHGKDMYVLQNSRPTIDVSMMNGGAKTRPNTGANTPNAGPKKKISLDAYKRKQIGANGTPEREGSKMGEAPAKQAAVKGPIERVKAENEAMLATIAEADGDLAPIVAEKPVPEQKELKRKREEALPKQDHADTIKVPSAMSTWDAAAAPHDDIEPPMKKAKVVADQLSKRDTQDKPKSPIEQASHSTKKVREGASPPPRSSSGMPPRLSPGLPQKLSPLRKVEDTTVVKHTEPYDSAETHALPSRLSPTIPDNILKSLEARSATRSTPQPLNPTSALSSITKSKDDKLTPNKQTESATKRKSPVPRNAFRANSASPAVRSDAEERPRPAPPNSRAKTPILSQDDEKAVGKALGAKQDQRHGKESLLLKLKYKKARREAIQRILKLPPKPAKIHHAEESTMDDLDESKAPAKTVYKRPLESKETEAVKGVAQKIGPAKKKKPKPPEVNGQPSAEKRPPPSSDEHGSPAKRKRSDESETRKGPSTPMRRENDSPLAQKSTLPATPGVRKDLLSVSMQRERSQDSVTTRHTPPEPANTPSMKSTSSQVHGAAKAPSTQPSTATPKQQAWEAEQKRLETLGRELKHAASAHLAACTPTSQPDTSSSQSLLTDQRLAAAKSLESFLCYLTAFTCADEASAAADPRQTPSFKTWRSLNGFFAFVKRTTEPFPPLQGLACCLGIVFTSRILVLATLYPSDGPSREGLLDTAALMHRSAAEAEGKLDVANLQEGFPKSWEGRERGVAGSSEKLDVKQLEGAYRLPMGTATSPIRAARAGCAILREWIESERVEYEMRLKL